MKVSDLRWICLRQKPQVKFIGTDSSLNLVGSVGVVAAQPWVSSAAVGSNPAQINNYFNEIFSTG